MGIMLLALLLLSASSREPAMCEQRGWTRRSFLQAAAAGVLGAAVAPSAAIFGESDTGLIIDCHPHVYGRCKEVPHY
jgi:hypothetical protein